MVESAILKSVTPSDTKRMVVTRSSEAPRWGPILNYDAHPGA